MTTPRNYETPQRKQSEISQAIPEKFRPHQGGKPGAQTHQRGRAPMTWQIAAAIGGAIAGIIIYIAFTEND